jgi:hypothetical protein
MNNPANFAMKLWVQSIAQVTVVPPSAGVNVNVALFVACHGLKNSSLFSFRVLF